MHDWELAEEHLGVFLRDEKTIYRGGHCWNFWTLQAILQSRSGCRPAQLLILPSSNQSYNPWRHHNPYEMTTNHQSRVKQMLLTCIANSNPTAGARDTPPPPNLLVLRYLIKTLGERNPPSSSSSSPPAREADRRRRRREAGVSRGGAGVRNGERARASWQ